MDFYLPIIVYTVAVILFQVALRRRKSSPNSRRKYWLIYLAVVFIIYALVAVYFNHFMKGLFQG